MFINLKVLDSESGNIYEKEAVLIGDGCAVINEGGSLSIKPVIRVKQGYETERCSKAADIFADPSIFDRIGEMAAQDYLDLCQ